MLGRPRRLALLAEQSFSPRDAKTAVGVLRYRTDEVAAVIDSARAGATAAACVSVGGNVPVVAGIEAAALHGCDTLLLGIAPQGGELPPSWRAVVCEALARGWDIVSGLHVFLADDPGLALLARTSGSRIFDVRRPPAGRPVAARRAMDVDAMVVLTIGSDCNVGKMTASLELVEALRGRGVRASFVATGQTGIMIADHGVAIDAVAADFAAGEVERLVVAAARDSEVVVVEGQGALHHPGYSGVALAVMHGACPEALVLCHWAGRTRLRVADDVDVPLPPLAEVRAAAEQAAAWVRPAATVAVALNTLDLGEAAARAACDAVGRELQLPVSDPVRWGAASLTDAVVAAWERRRQQRTTDGWRTTLIARDEGSSPERNMA